MLSEVLPAGASLGPLPVVRSVTGDTPNRWGLRIRPITTVCRRAPGRRRRRRRCAGLIRPEPATETESVRNLTRPFSVKPGRLDAPDQARGRDVTTSTVTATTEAERERRIAEAVHSGEMEGLHVTPAGRADAGEYIAGRIDSDELVARARARYGLG